MILTGTPNVLSLTTSWIVVDKPPGWLVIPGRGPGRGPGREPLGAQAAASPTHPVLKEWLERQIGERVFTVHRIDKETSGIVLFARDENAHREASTWFARHQVKKVYELLASGSAPEAPIIRISEPIAGAPSVTQLEVRERYGNRAFLGWARPLSGRRHQIRIHLATRGNPLLGDVTYGGPRAVNEFQIERVALHAARLGLPSGEAFEAPRPEDFARWVRELRQ